MNRTLVTVRWVPKTVLALHVPAELCFSMIFAREGEMQAPKDFNEIINQLWGVG